MCNFMIYYFIIFLFFFIHWNFLLFFSIMDSSENLTFVQSVLIFWIAHNNLICFWSSVNNGWDFPLQYITSFSFNLFFIVDLLITIFLVSNDFFISSIDVLGLSIVSLIILLSSSFFVIRFLTDPVFRLIFPFCLYVVNHLQIVFD